MSPTHPESGDSWGGWGAIRKETHWGVGGSGHKTRQRRDRRGRDSRKRQPETLPPNDQRGPGQSEETARDSQRKTGA